MRKPLNLVDIDTDSYIEGSLPILFLVYLYLLASLSETHIYLVQSETILSFLYSQFNIDGYSITYICPSYSHFFQAIWWNTRTVDSFFFFVLASAFMNENKKKESLIMIWISVLDFSSMGCIFFL